jgi:Na+-transporting NADH:ubiquinone oxidoreductase subunit NqrF
VIKVKGLASGRILELDYNQEDLGRNLMFYLRSKDVTIASSCDGEGVCQKCAIQKDWLTCQLTVSEFLALEPSGIVEVGYL